VRRGHERVLPAHIFLAIIRSDDGAAATALDAIGADRAALRSHVEGLMPEGHAPRDRGEVPYDRTGVAIIQTTVAEAGPSGDPWFSTAHELLAILATPDVTVCQALERAGVSIPDLVRILRANAGDPR